MAHGAHGASGWVSSGNQPDGEHEGPGGASDFGIRGAERRLGSDLRRSKSSKRHMLQRAKRRSATPQPVTGFELVKQKISKLEDQRRQDAEGQQQQRQQQQSGVQMHNEHRPGIPAGSHDHCIIVLHIKKYMQRLSRAKPVTAPVRLKSCPCLQGITRGGAPAWTLDQAVIRRAGGGQS